MIARGVIFPRSVLGMVVCSSLAVLVADTGKLQVKQPYGIRMCERWCQSSRDCFSFLCDPSTLMCELGRSRRREIGVVRFNISKLPTQERNDCLTWFFASRSGRTICAQSMRELPPPNNIRKVNISPQNKVLCHCIFNQCNLDRKMQARRCLTRQIKDKSSANTLANSYVKLGKCNMSRVTDNMGSILHMAVYANLINLTRCLLFKQINIIDIKNAQGITPIFMAVKNNRLTISNMLIQAGARLDTRYKNGETVLHVACRHANIDIVKSILDKGQPGDIDSRSINGQTSTMYAVSAKKLDILKYLVKRGCRVALTDRMHRTPLHQAASIDAVEIVKYILSNDLVDQGSRDGRGRTPIYIAASRGFVKSFELLAEKGCDLTVRDNRNTTLLQAACKSGNHMILDKIVKLTGGVKLC